MSATQAHSPQNYITTESTSAVELHRKALSLTQEQEHTEQIPAAIQARARGKGRIIRYRIDIISVLVVMAALSLQLTAYFKAWPWYALIPIMIGVRALHLVQHNHTHLRIFRQNALNELLGWMFFISNGVAVEGYELHHVRNHHRFAEQFGGKDYDWSSTFGFVGCRYPDKPMNRVYYSLTYGPIAIMCCLIEFIRMPGTPIFWSFIRTLIVFLTASGLMIAHDPWHWFLFFGLPMIIVWLSLGNNNYDHHERCDMANPYSAARVNLRFPYCLFGFNIGYHVEHHLKPSLHWSLLPLFHEEIKEHIPQENYVPPYFAWLGSNKN